MTETLPVLGLVAIAILVLLFLRRWSEVRPSVPYEIPQQPPTATTPPDSGFPAERAAPAGDTSRVLITHPLVRRAAERALASGGDSAKYIASDGADLYFVLDALDDPEERRRAHEVLTSMQAGGGDDLDMIEALQLVRRLTGG